VLCRSLLAPLSPFFWPLYGQSFFNCRLLIALSFGHCTVSRSSIVGFWLPFPLAIVRSVVLQLSASDCPFFWPLYGQSFFNCRLLIALSFGHCTVNRSSIVGFWLPFHVFKLYILVMVFWKVQNKFSVTFVRSF
jgi:hypothetical protein